MKKIIYPLLLLSSVLFSCTKTPSDLEPETVVSGFQASWETENDMGARGLLTWHPDDQIALSGATSSYKAEVEAETSETVLKGRGAVAYEGAYYAANPYVKVNSWISPGVAEMVLPTLQIPAPESMDPAALLAVSLTGKSQMHFVFRPVPGILSFSIGEEVRTVQTVKVKSPDNGPLAGTFRVDCMTMQAEPVRSESSVMLFSTSALAPGEYHIAIMPGNYPQGMELEFKYTDGQTNVVRLTGITDVKSGKIYNAGAATPVVDAFPVDPDATKATKELYRYLRENYGKKVIAGDCNMNVQGFTPQITSYDLMFYTDGCRKSGTTLEDGIPYRINWLASHPGKNGKPGGILTLHWHWFAPKDGYAFYRKSQHHPDGTEFDVTKAVTPGTVENDLILKDIDDIAAQLSRLDDENIPVLFRPLHEAGGDNGDNAWFWWGAKGPEPCKELWNLLYDRLVNYHGLHNLIWVWSSPVDGWYPGNEKVDILGFDSYPVSHDHSPRTPQFNQLKKLCQGQKMIAMTENSCLPDIERSFAEGATWLYFMTWYGFHETHNTTDYIRKVFSDERVVTYEKIR